MDKMVTILTPTYNRANLLENCYKSLINQTNKEFKWLIIDDGSTDNTKEKVDTWIKESIIEIEYIYKNNEGKHTALNLGFEKVNTELTFIVDSDDVLTSDAIATITCDWKRYNTSSISGLSYLRGFSKNDVIGDSFPNTYVEYNPIDIQFRYKISGDKAEVWRTDILKKYKFPVYNGEKFQGENYIWWQIALKYNMLYINKIIYITEYHAGGLTKSGRKLRINCPLGGMDNSKMGFDPRFPIQERLKRGILFNCYAFFRKDNKTNRFKETNNHLILVGITYPFGWLLYLYWKKYL